MKPWEKYQSTPSGGGPKPWERYSGQSSGGPQRQIRGNPVDARALAHLGNREDVRAELHPRDLGQLDFGSGDSPELRAAVGDARDRVSDRLGEGVERDTSRAGFHQYRARELGRVASFTAGVQNGTLLGMGDRVNAGVDRAGTTLSGGETEGRNFLAESRETRGGLIDEFPIAYTAGEIGGFLAPGSVAFNAVSKGAKAVGVGTGLSRAVPTGGSVAARGTRYASRLAPAVAGGTADAALYGGTSATANQEARTGEDATIGDRLNNAGEHAPYGAVAAPILSGLYRTGVRARTGQWTPNNVLRQNAEQGITAGGGDAKQLIINTIETGGDVPRGTANALLSILDQSGLSRGHIMRGVTDAVQAVESGVEAGGRAPIFGNALASAFEETPEVANNLQKVLRQLQTNGPRQGNAPAIAREGLNTQAKSQQQHLQNVFARELGQESVFDERKALEAVHKHKANQGYEQALRAVDTTSHNPNPSAQHGFSQVDAITGLREGLTDAAQYHRPTLQMIARERGHDTIETLIQKEPQYAAHGLQSKLRQSGQFADQELGRDLLQRLERASLFVRRNGANRELPSSEYSVARNQFRERSQQLETADIGKKLLTKVKDGERADDILLSLRTLEPESRRIAALSIKEALENVFRGTNSDEVIKNLSTLNQLRKSGLHDFLEDALGEQGRRITQNIQQVLDERNFLVGARPERLGQKPNASDLVEARKLYTKNPIARATEGLDWRSAITADIGTSVTGLPVPPGTVTAAKTFGSMLGAGKKTREGLARLLTESRAAPVQARQPRVPAQQAPIPASAYRDETGRIQRGSATPTGQLPRPAEDGVLPPLGARQQAPAPERPTGSTGTQTRQSALGNTPTGQPQSQQALPPKSPGNAFGAAAQAPSITKKARQETDVRGRLDDDVLNVQINGGYASGSHQLRTLAQDASERSQQHIETFNRYLNAYKTRSDLSRSEKKSIVRVLQKEAEGALRSRLEASQFDEMRTSWGQSEQQGQSLVSPVFRGSRYEVEEAVKAELGPMLADSGLSTATGRALSAAQHNMPQIVGATGVGGGAAYLGANMMDGLREKKTEERVSRFNSEISKVTEKWVPRDRAEIYAYQSILRVVVDDALEMDGGWGANTERALRDYQRRNNGLIPSGRMDEKTHTALMSDAKRLGINVEEFGAFDSRLEATQ